jgi:hypothetical protein
MHLVDPDDRNVVVSFAGASRTVLYVFRPTCIWCKRNKRALHSLVSQLSPGDHLIALSLTSAGLSEVAKAEYEGIPTFWNPDRALMERLHLGATPETIVVSKSGAVEASWTGVYTGTTRRAIEALFAVHIEDALEGM